MEDRKRLVWGLAAGCVIPLAWVLFFVLCGQAASDGEGMGYLAAVIVPLMYGGSAACVVWLAGLFHHWRSASRWEWLLGIWNLATLLSAAPMVLGSLPALLGTLFAIGG